MCRFGFCPNEADEEGKHTSMNSQQPGPCPFCPQVDHSAEQELLEKSGSQASWGVKVRRAAYSQASSEALASCGSHHRTDLQGWAGVTPTSEWDS